MSGRGRTFRADRLEVEDLATGAGYVSECYDNRVLVVGVLGNGIVCTPRAAREVAARMVAMADAIEKAVAS